MNQPRQKPPKHNLTRLRLFLEKSQREMAGIIGCSFDTIQSIELRRLPLTEKLARRISAATDVHFRWLLENNLRAPIVRAKDGRWPYTRSDFEQRQATKHLGDDPLTRLLNADYAVSFYGQIRAILSSAAKKDLAEVATWRIAKFLEDCRREFGHDRQLIGSEEQFGLRGDDSPYLKFRQINAGLNLFRLYERERKRAIKSRLATSKRESSEKKRPKADPATNRQRLKRS
jgi:transcriptional regulator with XRE-family HTH domain